MGYMLTCDDGEFYFDDIDQAIEYGEQKNFISTTLIKRLNMASRIARAVIISTKFTIRRGDYGKEKE